MNAYNVLDSMHIIISKGYGSAKVVIDCGGEHDGAPQTMREVNGFGLADDWTYFDNTETKQVGRVIHMHPMTVGTPKKPE